MSVDVSLAPLIHTNPVLNLNFDELELISNSRAAKSF